MSLTFNLILALFLLAPGLGVFAGLYAGGKPPFRPAPAEPGSIHALAVVSIGALLCHAICGWLFVAMEAYCAGHQCIPVDFNPNPYATILELREAALTKPGAVLDSVHPRLSDQGIAWLFTTLLLVGFVGFVLGLLTIVLVNVTGVMRATVYGWADELLRLGSTKAHVFTAYVLTDTEQDGKLLGYEGALVDMRQSPSGEIRIVVLRDAEPFVVAMKNDSARRQREPDQNAGKVMKVLTIEGAHIKNISFRAFLDPRRLSDRQYNRMKQDGYFDTADISPPRKTKKQSGSELRNNATGAGEPKPKPRRPERRDLQVTR